MKRVALARTVSLSRKSPLARTALRSARQPSALTGDARKPAERVQERATKRPGSKDTGNDWTDATRALVAKRAGGACEVRVAGCLGQATDLHHRKRRREGDHRTLNAVHCCRICHGEVHRSPAISKVAGWIVPSWDDPAVVPVRIFGRSPIWLTEDGEYVGEAGAA